MSHGQTAIPCAYLRGGSSKATFFQKKHLPQPGALRDAVLKRVNGTPDPLHIDGMGGSRVVTSKIGIVSPSDRDDADVDYTFCQVGIDTPTIEYHGNCGNISAAVGPFAIDERLIKGAVRPGVSTDGSSLAREVRIYNTGTKKVLVAHVPVDSESGMSVFEGKFTIAAVPGSGAPILMDYRDTLGASRKKGMLPTGNAVDTINLEGKDVSVSICDVANICVFVAAGDVGLAGTETAQAINENIKVIARCKELRGRAAKLLGMCQDWELADEQAGGLPLLVIVSPPPATSDVDLTSRLLLHNKCHDSMAGTGAICTAACSRVMGSVVASESGRKELEKHFFRIAHPLGMMPVQVQVGGEHEFEMIEESRSEAAKFVVLAFVRTSRRIMDGNVYVPASIWNGQDELDG